MKDEVKKEIEQIVKYCENRDKTGQKYYLSIKTGKYDEYNDTLLLQHDNNKNATGSGILLETIETIRDFEPDYIIFEFYLNCKKDHPDTKKPFKTQKVIIRDNPKKNELAGFSTLMGIDTLEGVRNHFNKEIDRQMNLRKLEMDIEQYQYDINTKNKTIKKLHQKLISYKKRKRDLEIKARRNKKEANKYKNRATLGSLAGRGLVGAVMDKLKIDESVLAGIFPGLADEDPITRTALKPNQNANPNQVSVELSETEELSAEQIRIKEIANAITKWLMHTNNVNVAQKVYQVIEYVAKGPDQLKIITELIKQ